MQVLREVTKKLDLAVNEEKTRICRVPEGSFDFLGYTFGRCHSHRNGRAYLGTKPSRKSIKRVCDAIRAETGRHTLIRSAEQMVELLNWKLQGWANYSYCVNSHRRAFGESLRWQHGHRESVRAIATIIL